MLVSLLILLIVLAIFYVIVNALPLPQPIKTVAWLVLLLVALLWLLGLLGGVIPVSSGRLL